MSGKSPDKRNAKKSHDQGAKKPHNHNHKMKRCQTHTTVKLNKLEVEDDNKLNLTPPEKCGSEDDSEAKESSSQDSSDIEDDAKLKKVPH